MRIDWIEYEDKNHVLAWFLSEAMSGIGIEKFGDFDSTDLDVVLTVNGIEVPVVAPMEFLESQVAEKDKEINELKQFISKWVVDYCMTAAESIERMTPGNVSHQSRQWATGLGSLSRVAEKFIATNRMKVEIEIALTPGKGGERG